MVDQKPGIEENAWFLIAAAALVQAALREFANPLAMVNWLS
ncbi:MAG: hypothetical protein ACYTGS_00825 [Planctomycetota bacterium]|jgi:hypothetical protein